MLFVLRGVTIGLFFFLRSGEHDNILSHEDKLMMGGLLLGFFSATLLATLFEIFD